MSVFDLERWIVTALTTVLLVIEVWALVNALRFRPDAYVAADKRTKGFWILLTVVGVLLGGLSLLGNGIGLLALVGVVMAGVFLADVLPALRTVMGNAQGPYRRR